MKEKLIKLEEKQIITQGYRKSTLEFYQEKGAGREYVHIQACLSSDSGLPVLVDLTENLHYTYVNGKIHLYIDGSDLKKTFSLSLENYRVGYISKALKDKIIKEKYDDLAYRRIAYAPTGMFKKILDDDS